MRIVLHIGLPCCGGPRLQEVMEAKRGQLAKSGVLFSGIGRRNHTRLYMAATDPKHVEPLRLSRGFGPAKAQAALARRLLEDLQAEVARETPDVLLLSCHQLGMLPNASEVRRLHDMIATLSDDIAVIAHVDEQARVLIRQYAETISNGRLASLDQELTLAEAEDWRKAAFAGWADIRPQTNDYPEIQAAPFWLDYARLLEIWEGVIGPGSVTLRPYDPARFAGAEATEELREMLALTGTIGKAEPAMTPALPSAESLARARALNGVFRRLMDKGRVVPRRMWSRFIDEVAVPGDPIDPSALAPLSARFAPGNAELVARFPALAGALHPETPGKPWSEPAFTCGFRATHYAAAALPAIEEATEERRAKVTAARQGDAGPATAQVNGTAQTTYPETLSPSAEKILSPRAKENYQHLRKGRFAPHNGIGRVDDEALAAPYDEVPLRALPKGNSGNVIVGCMKNEAPYILEWVAYHRMVGVDKFLIYTNDCTDGTAEILDRLQELGVVEHRDNTKWKGNSPQQYALNKALKEPVIKTAEWVIHIDVDEFINVRTGNGRLQDFLALVPDATNVAMTWRLFGHNGVTDLSDDLVIAQFDDAAPKFCPKPHTAWGFKTMTKNMGAYEKLSCHRPNKLDGQKRDAVQWVNGSGRVMSESYKDKGWRSDLRTIGYDLLQLNHYALRSAESFLIKRQRGRALHVDRSIGINYWVRMDWGGSKDVTIKRNIPRVRAELARLLEDDRLRALHEEGFRWHRAKADELHATPEFRELYEQALETKLNNMERVAFALALDMES
ncbi:glycosyltransferase family 2 protein [Maritimibacter sp. DP1N21-5]|uniref:glycosyltransferase family 2 protein n=1 Tax=Maritimibacter sp. DP1N21-5 TaxID=2836867 RepID=UPI001C439B3B|nr:glycosyltransferase family 2 protein [Maritimibacter sp. DP1N21-5]MBV7410134.1 glycosyltransferase family 2 protein [Maritimibacter sp. DP1N21-5]